jgi:hypothetical protein
MMQMKATTMVKLSPFAKYSFLKQSSRGLQIKNALLKGVYVVHSQSRVHKHHLTVPMEGLNPIQIKRIHNQRNQSLIPNPSIINLPKGITTR